MILSNFIQKIALEKNLSNPIILPVTSIDILPKT